MYKKLKNSDEAILTFIDGRQCEDYVTWLQ